MTFMMVVALLLLIFTAAVVAAIANFLVRQQEAVLEPSVEEAEEDVDEE